MAIRAAMTASSSLSHILLRLNKSTTLTFSVTAIHRNGIIIFNPVYDFAAASFSSSSSVDFTETDATSSTQKLKKNRFTERLTAVIDAVNDRKLPPELRGQRNNVRSETDIINVVEHRIWQSMEEGHFENLPGKGKPLDLKTNPHADPAEDTLYRILSKNGCAPEWVELNKQIRTEAAEWRTALKRAWAFRMNANDAKWSDCSEALKVQMKAINDKVFRYNLVVPFGRQMIGIKWEKELDRLRESQFDSENA